MTGRGHPGRGGNRSHSSFVLDSFNRRGRGRPRRFPLATQPQMPDSDNVGTGVDEEFHGVQEEEYYQEEHVGEDDVEDDGGSVASDSNQLGKIKEIQQRKMMMVTPMAQKRIRGRPRRQSTSSQATMNDDILENDLMMMEHDLLESGPLEGPSQVKSPPTLGRGSRVRQVPKRLNDFVKIETSRPSKQSKTQHQQHVPSSIPLTSDVNKNMSDNDSMPPLIHDDRIEQEEEMTEASEGRELIEEQEDDDDIGMVMQYRDDMDNEQDELQPHGPPPPPRHLLNKANCRGRPANPIPPHRRPIPKDLVPPGAQVLKRSSALKDPNPAKRKDNRDKSHIDESNEKPPPLHPPRAPMALPDECPPSPLPLSEATHADMNLEAPVATKEVEISDDGPPPMPQIIQQASAAGTSSSAASTSTQPDTPQKKKEREGGMDLPSEHFPKEKARHVSTRGLHPFAEDKSPMLSYEMREEGIMHPEDMEEQGAETVAQQRVLTLQGGSFIDDHIGRADMMEDEEMKMIKGMQSQQYIVEENGVNVVYEMDPNDVIDGGEQVEMQRNDQADQEGQYDLEDQMQLKNEQQLEEDDDDDDLPPQLIPEGVPTDAVGDDDADDEVRVKGDPGDEEGSFDFNMMHEGEMIRLQSPGGRDHEVRVARDEDGNTVFVDENGHIVELVTDTGALVEPGNMVEQDPQEGMEQEEQVDLKVKQQMQQQGNDAVSGPGDRANMEFMNSCSFLDTNNICCGLCGEIVAYDKLVSEHLPTAHPEYLAPGVELEEVPYNSWLKTRLKQESKMMANGFRHYDEHDGAGFGGTVRLYSKGLRQLRKVSQIRVNVNEMSMAQLEQALKKKLLEKMGRKVPVSLVDRLHARCDICQAVVSLNKKFEVIHLVRHFNAWHPAEHRCTQEWKDVTPVTTTNSRRPLSLHDFAVVSTDTDQNNLQCIWCGMMMDRAALGMHFSEVHAQQVVVPNCSLCLQEMVMTARLMEKYGEDFGISLPDEFHLLSSKLNAKYSSEKAMDRAIDKYLKRTKGHEHEEEEGGDDQEAICTTNSQQSFGRRNRLKRKFVKPCFRQICPVNSEYFEAKSACEWKCRLCNRNVYGAVISAGAIKHFKEFHPAEIDRMQYELVKARLERIGDGSMEFVHPQLVECLICSLTYALHKPFNICRAIRHLRLKHPEVMPETAGKPISGAEVTETTNIQSKPAESAPRIRFGEIITDPIELEKFRKDNFDQNFDKVQVMYGIKKNNEPSFILLMEDEQMDEETALEMAARMRVDHEEVVESRFDQLVGREDEEVIQIHEPQYESITEPSGSQIYDEETKPIVMDFPEQIVEEEVEEIDEMVESNDADFMQTYDANNPDHVLIEENDLLTDGQYEMIPDGEYQEIEDNRAIRYLTEEEIQEAQARGEILEFEEADYVEYADQ